MKKELQNLVTLYENTGIRIRHILDRIGNDECNCADTEEIVLVCDNEENDLGIERRCGNCGGVIWDREI